MGDGFTLIGAVAFGAHTVATQIYTKRYDFIQLTFLQILITGIGGLLSTLILETPRFEANPQLILIVLGTAIFPTVLNFYILNKYQHSHHNKRSSDRSADSQHFIEKEIRYHCRGNWFK